MTGRGAGQRESPLKRILHKHSRFPSPLREVASGSRGRRKWKWAQDNVTGCTLQHARLHYDKHTRAPPATRQNETKIGRRNLQAHRHRRHQPRSGAPERSRRHRPGGHPVADLAEHLRRPHVDPVGHPLAEADRRLGLFSSLRVELGCRVRRASDTAWLRAGCTCAR